MTITIDSNFPGGAIDNVVFDGEHIIRFSAPLDGSPFGMWYYFRVRGANRTRLTFVQTHLETVLEGYNLATVQPVVKRGSHGEWSRISRDNVTFSKQPHRFEFTVDVDDDEIYVAYCYPYQLRDLESLIKTYSHSTLSVQTIGTTETGRPLPMLVIGDLAPREGKKLIVCTARHHAGETAASYVLEGLMHEALESQVKDLLNDMVLAVFPMVDLDGVEDGRYGKDRPPVDFNRDWVLHPKHREVASIQSVIQQLAEQYDYVFFADLHCPQPFGLSYLLPARRAHQGDGKWEHFWKFAYTFEQAVEDFSRCRVSDIDPLSINWGVANYKSVSRDFQAIKHGATAITLETSYHLDGNGKLLGPSEWRKMGRKLLQCVTEYYIHPSCRDISGGPQIDKKPLTDQVWRQWESVTIPKNVEVAEQDKSLVVSPTDSENELWITMLNHRTSDSPEGLTLTNHGNGPAVVETLLYFYSNGVFVGKSKPVYVLVEPGEFPFWPDVRNDSEINEYCVSMKMQNLTGPLIVSLRDQYESNCLCWRSN